VSHVAHSPLNTKNVRRECARKAKRTLTHSIAEQWGGKAPIEIPARKVRQKKKRFFNKKTGFRKRDRKRNKLEQLQKRPRKRQGFNPPYLGRNGREREGVEKLAVAKRQLARREDIVERERNPAT